MILLINLCKEKLHEYEFVKPIENILKNNKIKYLKKHYKKIKKRDLKKIKKIIICGTSLKDSDYIKDINCFRWINDSNKSILGICAGMQIIGLVFNGKIQKKTEIGFYDEILKKEFLKLNNSIKVYSLHNYYVNFNKLKNFEIFNKGKIPQAVKHKEKEIYGVLFHPEARQKDLIKNFCLL